MVDCQSDYLRYLPTRFVVPLLPIEDSPVPAERFNPVLRFDGADYMFSPQYAANVDRSDLGKAEGSLTDEYWRMTGAIDFLIGGF